MLIVDGQGEDEATSIFSARYGEPIVRKDRWATPASIGYMYKGACQAIGLDFLEAGKTMGLASYGRAAHEADLLMEWDGDTYRQPFDISDDDVRRDGGRLGGRARHTLSDLPRTTPRSTLHEDNITVHITYSAQATVEDLGSRLVDLARTRVGTQNLCLGGGVGLNCSVNGMLASPVYVPPVTYRTPASRSAQRSSSRRRRAGAAAHAVPRPHDRREQKPRIRQGAAGAPYVRFDTDDVVRRLLDGKIGAIAWGRAEVGARALGHRSILALPNRAEVADQVNPIKSRELWRPLAPVGLPSVEGSYWAPHTLLHKYMLGAVEVTDLARTPSKSRRYMARC